MEIFSESYKKAGVDVTAGYKAVELMKKHVDRTKTSGVLEGIGGFGGLFAPSLTGMEEPILVSGTDGVGTKLKVAFLMDKHDTIGIDSVAMCVNDIICAGAAPMFFLDYLAMGKNFPEKVEQIVSGVAEGCVQSACALIGGESAEMPGFYPENEYDLAGFAVGIVDKKNIVNKENVKAGDVVIGIASSGVHSNGFSLIRAVLGNDEASMKKYEDSLGMTVGECLLTPTKIYVKPVLELLKKIKVHSMSNITGGGFYENIPRALPEGLGVKIDKSSFDTPPIFNLIASKGNISEKDMFATFNMGIGMCIVVAAEDAQKTTDSLKASGENAYVIGEVTSSVGVEII